MRINSNLFAIVYEDGKSGFIKIMSKDLDVLHIGKYFDFNNQSDIFRNESSTVRFLSSSNDYLVGLNQVHSLGPYWEQSNKSFHLL